MVVLSSTQNLHELGGESGVFFSVGKTEIHGIDLIGTPILLGSRNNYNVGFACQKSIFYNEKRLIVYAH